MAGTARSLIHENRCRVAARAGVERRSNAADAADQRSRQRVIARS
jgi:hypothetical protein